MSVAARGGSAADTRPSDAERGTRESRDLDPRRARIALALILVFAFVVRVVYVLQSRANPFFDEPTMDAGYHVEWARAFASGETFRSGPFFRAPLYPWFLGLSFRVFGEDLLWPRIVQAAIGTLSCALVYRIGAFVFDRRTGLLAAFGLAAYWIVVYFDGELLSPVLEVFLDLAAILVSLSAGRTGRARDALLAGLLWGLSAIVRPNVLLFLPLLALWLLLEQRRERGWRTRLALAAALAAGASAPILPITAYNRFAGGDTALVATNAGVNLWIGNHPASDGSSAIVPGTREDWWGGFEDSIRLAELEAGRALRPSEVSDHYTEKALDAMRADPARAARHFLWKLELFWKDWELGNNQDERFFALRFGPILRFLPVGFAIAAALGLAGFALAVRRAGALFPLWGFLPVYTAGVVLFFVNARYRVPVLPVLVLFGAYALTWALDAWRARRRLAVGALALSALALGAWVRDVPEVINQSDGYGHWQLGVFAAQHGDPAAAAEHFEAAITAWPRRSVFHKDLAVARRVLGERRAARESVGRALALSPDDPASLQLLFELELEEGRLAEAHAVARRLRERLPHFASGLYDLGRVLGVEAERAAAAGDAGLARAKREEALVSFDRCAAAGPGGDAFACAFGAGVLSLQLGRAGEAVSRFERALAAIGVPGDADAEAWYWRAQGALLEALAASGRGPEARARAEELVRRHASDARALALRDQASSR